MTGWVRNRSDGAVEALLHGVGGDLEALIVEMRQGPRGSGVARVQFEEIGAGDAEASGEFIILPTE